jgi:hypothetical protein
MTGKRDARPFSQRYFKVTCPCGRSLRAPRERVGATVRCWDCRRSVTVPVPRHPGRAARVLSGGIREAFEGASLSGVAAGALAFTGAMFLPVPEPVLAGLVLALGVFGYGELVRRGGLSSLPGFGPGPSGVRTLAARVAATLAVALFLTNLWVVSRGWLPLPPDLLGRGMVLGAVLVVVVPLTMLFVWAAPEPRQAFKAVTRHPLSTVASLAIVPIGLVAAEAAGVFVASLQGMFAYYVYDLFPGAEALAPKYGVEMIGAYLYPVYPETGLLSLYGACLRHGMTLSVALPASLGVAPNSFTGNWILQMYQSDYLWYRTLHTFTIAAVWMLALTVQARCLGRISRLGAWYFPETWAATAPPAEPVETETESEEAAVSYSNTLAVSGSLMADVG